MNVGKNVRTIGIVIRLLFVQAVESLPQPHGLLRRDTKFISHPPVHAPSDAGTKKSDQQYSSRKSIYSGICVAL